MRYDANPPWPAVGMAYARYPNTDQMIIVAIGQTGDVWEVILDTAAQRLTKIPGDRLGLTKLANIDNAIWACGMGRTVLRREKDGTWIDVSAPAPSVDEGVIGFTALSAIAPNEMVTVGWQGEIWIRSNDVWKRQETKTKANFNAVSVGPDGTIVAVGDNGAIVVGRNGTWSMLSVRLDCNLQGVAHFGGELFVCSDERIFRLKKGALVRETRFAGKDRPKTCLNLLRGSLSLYAQGERDIFRFLNQTWTRLV